MSVWNVISQINFYILYTQSAHCQTLYSLKLLNLHLFKKKVHLELELVSPKRL